jgi:hypothetical protein
MPCPTYNPWPRYGSATCRFHIKAHCVSNRIVVTWTVPSPSNKAALQCHLGQWLLHSSSCIDTKKVGYEIPSAYGSSLDCAAPPTKLCGVAHHTRLGTWAVPSQPKQWYNGTGSILEALNNVQSNLACKFPLLPPSWSPPQA